MSKRKCYLCGYSLDLFGFIYANVEYYIYYKNPDMNGSYHYPRFIFEEDYEWFLQRWQFISGTHYFLLSLHIQQLIKLWVNPNVQLLCCNCYTDFRDRSLDDIQDTLKMMKGIL